MTAPLPDEADPHDAAEQSADAVSGAAPSTTGDGLEVPLEADAYDVGEQQAVVELDEDEVR